MECERCGREQEYIAPTNGQRLCDECLEKDKETLLDKKSETVHRSCDFKSWDSGDMSDLFWIHLGRYIKNPNEHSLNIMEMAFSWACHTNHGLVSSFSHALKWAKIDLFEEESKYNNIT